MAKESVDFEGRTSGLKFSNVIGSVKTYIQNRPGAVFQVASQFNCLEMVGPAVTPNHGITQYVLDKTQGPACALACPGGTLFRNYFVNGSGQGTGGAQINTLSSVEKLLASGKSMSLTQYEEFARQENFLLYNHDVTHKRRLNDSKLAEEQFRDFLKKVDSSQLKDEQRGREEVIFAPLSSTCRKVRYLYIKY